MPENNTSPVQPEPEASPGEFDFAKSETEAPRMKTRSLKTPSVQPQVVLKPRTTPSMPEQTPAVERVEEPSPARPASNTTGARIASTSNPTTSPHGTRPATLYYSTSPRKDKEESPSMKSTPAATPASSSTAQPSSVTRSAVSSARPAGVVDYRTNVERQSREQKSVGGVLSILVYTLIGLFVLSAVLAGYGAYTVSKQLHAQSVTVDDLDARLTAKNVSLETDLKSTMGTLAEAQAQIGRQQELILKQQDSINKLIAVSQDNATALKTERQTRAAETASLRARLKDLEYRGPSTQKY